MHSEAMEIEQKLYEVAEEAKSKYLMGYMEGHIQVDKQNVILIDSNNRIRLGYEQKLMNIRNAIENFVDDMADMATRMMEAVEKLELENLIRDANKYRKLVNEERRIQAEEIIKFQKENFEMSKNFGVQKEMKELEDQKKQLKIEIRALKKQKQKQAAEHWKREKECIIKLVQLWKKKKLAVEANKNDVAPIDFDYVPKFPELSFNLDFKLLKNRFKNRTSNPVCRSFDKFSSRPTERPGSSSAPPAVRSKRPAPERIVEVQQPEKRVRFDFTPTSCSATPTRENQDQNKRNPKADEEYLNLSRRNLEQQFSQSPQEKAFNKNSNSNVNKNTQETPTNKQPVKTVRDKNSHLKENVDFMNFSSAVPKPSFFTEMHSKMAKIPSPSQSQQKATTKPPQMVKPFAHTDQQNKNPKGILKPTPKQVNFDIFGTTSNASENDFNPDHQTNDQSEAIFDFMESSDPNLSFLNMTDVQEESHNISFELENNNDNDFMFDSNDKNAENNDAFDFFGEPGNCNPDANIF